MRSEWYSAELGQLVDFIDYRGKTPPKQSFGVPLVTAKIIKDNTIKKPQEYIDYDFYDKWMRRGIPQKGDIVFTTEAPLGEIAQIKTDEKLAFAQRIIIFHSHTEILHNNYLFYALQYPVIKKRIEARSTGTTVLGIKSAELKKVIIDFPNTINQKAIAATLSCLDDKIELNNKIKANLEAQVQAIFKNWFVNFEPFQDGEFVDSELGRIPKGWQVVALEDIANYVKQRIPINECNEENYISTENMLANKQGISNANSLPTTATVNRYENNDILISNIRPYFKKIWFADKVGGCSNDVLVIRAKNEITNGYLYGLLYSDEFFEHMISTSKGTKMPRGDKVAIMRYKMALPTSFETNKYIGEFNLFVKLCQKKIQAMRSENGILATIRDALLPKLMNGDIEVPISNEEIVESYD